MKLNQPVDASTATVASPSFRPTSVGVLWEIIKGHFRAVHKASLSTHLLCRFSVLATSNLPQTEVLICLFIASDSAMANKGRPSGY